MNTLNLLMMNHNISKNDGLQSVPVTPAASLSTLKERSLKAGVSGLMQFFWDLPDELLTDHFRRFKGNALLNKGAFTDKEFDRIISDSANKELTQKELETLREDWLSIYTNCLGLTLPTIWADTSVESLQFHADKTAFNVAFYILGIILEKLDSDAAKQNADATIQALMQERAQLQKEKTSLQMKYYQLKGQEERNAVKAQKMEEMEKSLRKKDTKIFALTNQLEKATARIQKLEETQNLFSPRKKQK